MDSGIIESMNTTATHLGVALLVLLAVPACGSDEAVSASSADAFDAGYNPPVESTEIFAIRCSVCHGTSGVGDGAAAVALDPKPRNYQDKTWQASVSNEEIAEIIVKGGAAMGKSALMPPNPDLESKPEVVQGLVFIIREFAKQD